MSKRGKPLSPELKKKVVLIKHYFDQNKLKPTVSSTTRTAESLDIGVATVKRIMASYNRNPILLDAPLKERGRPSYSVAATHQEAVRAYIRSANINGEHITLSGIHDFLIQQSAKSPFHLATLARTLYRWGFEFGKGTRSQHLKESDHVVVARQKYLRARQANLKSASTLKTKRPEVYLDESYVNKNHSNDFIWYSGEDGPWVQKPTGKGERLIIMNAITKEGWVPNAKLIFKSTRKTGDYHGQMNFDLFSKWFSEKLIPNIPKKTIIIMDNASYHNTLSDNSPPMANSSKTKITQWLAEKDIDFPEDCLKVELLEILEKENATPIYKIDEIAKKHGHDVLRTPPYHPELQPIETCWGVVKNHVARNCDFTMSNLEKQLEAGFNKVTEKTCSKILKKVRDNEEKFWSEDQMMDEKHP